MTLHLGTKIKIGAQEKPVALSALVVDKDTDGELKIFGLVSKFGIESNSDQNTSQYIEIKQENGEVVIGNMSLKAENLSEGSFVKFLLVGTPKFAPADNSIIWPDTISYHYAPKNSLLRVMNKDFNLMPATVASSNTTLNLSGNRCAPDGIYTNLTIVKFEDNATNSLLPGAPVFNGHNELYGVAVAFMDSANAELAILPFSSYLPSSNGRTAPFLYRPVGFTWGNIVSRLAAFDAEIKANSVYKLFDYNVRANQ